jgi:hypothetical protein
MKHVRFFAFLAALLSATPIFAEDTSQSSMCGRNGTIVDLIIAMSGDGIEGVWRDKTMFIFRDTKENAIWAFTVENTNAHPAALCRRDIKDGEATKTETGQICTASEKVCKSFSDQVNDRLAKLSAPANPTKK